MSKLQTQINKETLELIMTRVLNAPRQLVWDAFTKPELVSKWWGPRVFQTIVKEMDVRPGGVWHYCMHGIEGEWKDKDACGKAYYEEVVAPEKLVYKDVFADVDGNDLPDMPVALVTVTFEENEGKTTMISTTKYATLEDLQKVVEMGVEEGYGETLDRLEEMLAEGK
jgi:uncharacterized protein YndB with AHSA1/START domain